MKIILDKEMLQDPGIDYFDQEDITNNNVK